MTELISAYIPYFNNPTTIARVIESLQAQTHPIAEIWVIDDGSADPEALRQQLLPFPEVQVIWQGQNLGRGAARARAMTTVHHEWVLCCDATNCLDPQFLERALLWLEDPAVAGVFGRISQAPSANAVHRWRGRHLFKTEIPMQVNPEARLSTYGALVRRAPVLQVGNYDPQLRHSEDADLGHRLRAAGYRVVFDPQLLILSIADNSVAQVLERYWRWNVGVTETISWWGYLKLIHYSLKVMVAQDLRSQDPGSVPLSLVAPHYQFWRSWWRQRVGLAQKKTRLG